MTIQEIKDTYPMKAWWAYPGDRELRYELFAPLLQNLYEEKLIVRERIMGIVKVQKAVITPERFDLTLAPLLCIKGNPRYDEYFLTKKPWVCGAPWAYTMLGNGYLQAAMISWALWPEPDLVREVESLILAEDYVGARALLKE